jgi:hypothetical protein
MKGGYCHHPEGAYCHTPVPCAGFPGHGLASCPYYTNDQIKEFKRKEKEEMDCSLVMAMNESGSDQDKLEELSQDL